jgi:hypothetical protein
LLGVIEGSIPLFTRRVRVTLLLLFKIQPVLGLLLLALGRLLFLATRALGRRIGRSSFFFLYGLAISLFVSPSWKSDVRLNLRRFSLHDNNFDPGRQTLWT